LDRDTFQITDGIDTFENNIDEVLNDILLKNNEENKIGTNKQKKKNLLIFLKSL